MERYLLFDSGCGKCSRIASEVEREAGSWIKARSLHDPTVRQWLAAVRVRRLEPILLEVDGDRVRLFAGWALRARLVLGLGPVRAWRVAHVVHAAGVPLTPDHEGRRHFLRNAASAVAGLVIASVTNPEWVVAQETQKDGSTPPPIGPAAWRRGVRSYSVKDLGNNKLDITFTHKVAAKSGILAFKHRGSDTSGVYTLTLRRGNTELEANWDIDNGVFTIQSADRRGVATFLGGGTPGTWSYDEGWAGVWAIREDDINLMAAIATDFAVVRPTVANVVTASIPNASDPTKAQESCYYEYCYERGSGWVRSEACWNAQSAANGCCSNMYCWGCCAWASPEGQCDCVCAGGDVACYCGRGGWSCGP